MGKDGACPHHGGAGAEAEGDEAEGEAMNAKKNEMDRRKSPWRRLAKLREQVRSLIEDSREAGSKPLDEADRSWWLGVDYGLARCDRLLFDLLYPKKAKR